jgi:hypothetical protein
LICNGHCERFSAKQSFENQEIASAKKRLAMAVFLTQNEYILVKGYFVTVIASASQRSNLFKISRWLRQKTPRNDSHSNPQRV